MLSVKVVFDASVLYCIPPFAGSMTVPDNAYCVSLTSSNTSSPVIVPPVFISAPAAPTLSVSVLSAEVSIVLSFVLIVPIAVLLESISEPSAAMSRPSTVPDTVISPVIDTPVFCVTSLLLLLKYKLTPPFWVAAIISSLVVDLTRKREDFIIKSPVPESEI